MIQFWKTIGGCLAPTQVDGPGTWVDVRWASPDDLIILEKTYGILSEHLQDIVDTDEQSRLEKEESYTLLIVRLPVHDTRYEPAFFTAPVGIVLFPDKVITVCWADSEVLADLSGNRVRRLAPDNQNSFVLRLLGRAAMVFLRHLKVLNRRTSSIERELQRSVRNTELVQLLTIEKSLVYFTTSLKSNELLLEKLLKSRQIRFQEEEMELLEDVEIDNRQAITMANIYSDILSGMMDAFASVISNNLNIVMKRLTVISVVMMIPTFIVSIFGMNVPLPWSGNAHALWIIGAICAGSALLGALFLTGNQKHIHKTRAAVPATLVAQAATGMRLGPADKV
jgi:magnesium transporter